MNNNNNNNKKKKKKKKKQKKKKNKNKKKKKKKNFSSPFIIESNSLVYVKTKQLVYEKVFYSYIFRALTRNFKTGVPELVFRKTWESPWIVC